MPQARHRPPIAVLAGLILATCLLGCGDSADPTAGTTTGHRSNALDAFDASRAFTDLRDQVDLGPRPAGSATNEKSARMFAAELRRAGVEDVRIQRPERNVVGTIPGRGAGWVVVGAHHDTKPGIPGFVGANDGASGVAVVLELARSLPNPMPGPSVAIALFDGEEARGDLDFAVDGTRGSRQYVADARTGRQGTPPLSEMKAMVLFDMVGDCDLAIPREANSDPDLYGLFADADASVFADEAPAVDDDHTPFLDTGIPAVDLIDFSYGPGPAPGEYWHTSEDTVDHVCPESLDAVGGAALKALPQIGAG